MFLSSTKSNFPFHCDFNSRLSQLYWTLNGPTRTGWGWPCLKCSVSFTVPVNSVRSARLIWSLSRSLLSYLTHLFLSLLSDCNIVKAFKEKLSDNVHTYPPPPISYDFRCDREANTINPTYCRQRYWPWCWNYTFSALQLTVMFAIPIQGWKRFFLSFFQLMFGLIWQIIKKAVWGSWRNKAQSFLYSWTTVKNETKRKEIKNDSSHSSRLVLLFLRRLCLLANKCNCVNIMCHRGALAESAAFWMESLWRTLLVLRACWNVVFKGCLF